MSEQSITPAAIAEMRSWLADCEWHDITAEEIMDPAEVSDRTVVAMVRRHYEGGVEAFLLAIDTTPDDRVGSYDVSDVHLHTPDAPALAIGAAPLLAMATHRPLWALVAFVLCMAATPVVGYYATRQARPERKLHCVPPTTAAVEETPLSRWTRLWEERYPTVDPEYGRAGEPLPCKVVDIRGS